MYSIRGILFFLAASSLFPAQSLFGQRQDKQQSKAYMEVALLMMDAGPIAFEDARDVMVQAAELDTTNVKANFEAGRLFLATIHRKMATKYLTRVYRQSPEYDFDLPYLIGLGYQYGLQFDEAIIFYTRYKQKFVGKADNRGRHAPFSETERRIAECQTGKELLANPVRFNIVNLGAAINSEFEDYAPVLNESETEIAFTSRRRDGNMNQDVAVDNKPWEDIYYSRKGGDKWTSARNIGSPVSAPKHESTLYLSPDGMTLYIYKDVGSGDIFVSHKTGDGKWSPPELLPGVNSVNNKESSMSISGDGNVLYFASDRPGGMGGLDIYAATRDTKGNWIQPRNLGPTINTELDEEGPFIDFTGKTLYFSSEGRKGMGGHDIYKATLVNAGQNQWSEPENIGYPINTPYDDLFFVTTKDGKHAYYASERDDGFGYTDIYRIDMVSTTGHEKDSARKKVPGTQEQLQGLNRNNETKKTEAGRSSSLRNIYFDVNSAALTSGSYAELDKLENMLKQNPGMMLEIAGHADNFGPDDHNKRLSFERANAARNFLTGRGIDPDRIRAQGYGDTRPLVSNDDEKGGREINRRVEFRVITE